MKLVLNNVCQPQFKRMRLYPHCDKSKLLIKLMWDPDRKRVRKTFSEQEVELLRKVGFEIEIIGGK